MPTSLNSSSAVSLLCISEILYSLRLYGDIWQQILFPMISRTDRMSPVNYCKQQQPIPWVSRRTVSIESTPCVFRCSAGYYSYRLRGRGYKKLRSRKLHFFGQTGLQIPGRWHLYVCALNFDSAAKFFFPQIRIFSPKFYIFFLRNFCFSDGLKFRFGGG